MEFFSFDGQLRPLSSFRVANDVVINCVELHYRKSGVTEFTCAWIAMGIEVAV